MKLLYMWAMAAVYCIEPLLWLRSMEPTNHIYKRIRISVICFWGYYTITLIKQYFVFKGSGQTTILLLTIFLVVYIVGATFLIIQDTMQQKILRLGIFFICNLSTELLSVTVLMLCLHKRVSEISAFGIWNLICTLESKVLLIVLCHILFFTKDEKSLARIFGNSDLLPLIVVAVLIELPFSVVFCFSECFFGETINLFLFLVIQIYVVVLTSYIIHIAYKYQADMDDLQCELQKRQKFGRLNNKLTQLRHDLSFYTSMILRFVQKEQYIELREFVSEMAEEIGETEDIFLLSDQMVANTLDIMAQQMRERNIKFEHVIMISDFNITSNDISRVLYNLLRNAMEAVEKLEPEQRKVTLEIGRRYNGYHINCLNPYRKSPDTEKQLFTSSKMDKRMHGKGLSIIKQIVERNNGILKIHLHETLFEIDCYIPDKGVGM